jgi:superfamily I DNA/RNA helicase
MRHRISQMLPGIQLNDMWLGTFHGLGKYFLNKKIISFSF